MADGQAQALAAAQVAFDDCIGSALFAKPRKLNMLTTGSRHLGKFKDGRPALGINLFFTVQSLKCQSGGLNKAVRLQTTQYLIFKTFNEDELASLYVTCSTYISSEHQQFALRTARSKHINGIDSVLQLRAYLDKRITDAIANDASTTMREAKPPIVMVPGLAGSVFRARLTGTARPPHLWCERSSDWFVTWVSLAQLVPEQKDCLLARLLPHFNATDQTYHNALGVELDTNVDFGGVDGITFLDPSVHFGVSNYFGTMVAHFEAQGYTRGRDLHGAPYDWRAAPDGHRAPGMFFEQLAQLVEATVKRNGAKASIITHSLGGPTTLAFLLSRPSGWVQDHVANFIPISAPWGGAALMALSDISGDNFGIPFVSSDYLKPVQTASASGVFLLPTSAAFGDQTIVSAGGKNYSAKEMPILLKDLGLTEATQIYANLERLQLNADDLTAPPVRTLVITSSGVKTDERYEYADPLVPGFDKGPERIEYGDGDGTVNLVSLRFAQDGGWPSARDADRRFFEVKGVAHFDMVKEQRVLSEIDAFLGSGLRQ
ncbi:hypothetical protein AB1Y20_017682 [Prymnesium parvum]|uniref:Uncharacterized protein n=1 Tax=Prymnesium parvum TaxID=97485 RepID=A0AB34JP41_PRYPA